MDVASPLRAGIAAQATARPDEGFDFEWKQMATKFFAVIGDRPVSPRGHHSPMAQGEGVHR